jgi:hypothetical protein
MCTRQLFAFLLSVMSFVSGACSGDAPEPTETRTALGIAGGCEGLVGTRFASVELLEMGLGPDGRPVLGHWIVEFDENRVRFVLEDTWPTAAYGCKDGAITATSHRGLFKGTFDPATGVLQWNGHEYRKSE